MEDGDRREKQEALAILITAAACAVGGWLAFLIPYEVAHSLGITTATNPMDGMQMMITLLGIAGIGFVAGAAVPRGWFLWGPCSMVVLPCKAVIEILRDPTSHNLWPIEFGFYAVFTVPGILGAGLGALLRWGLDRRRPPSPPR